MCCRKGVAPPYEPIEDFFAANPEFISRALYAQRLETSWLPRFDRAYFNIAIFEEINHDVAKWFDDLVVKNLRTSAFFGYDERHLFRNQAVRDSVGYRIYNAARSSVWTRQLAKNIPHSKTLTGKLRNALLGRSDPLSATRMPEKAVQLVAAHCRKDVLRLKDLLGRASLPWHFQ